MYSREDGWFWFMVGMAAIAILLIAFVGSGCEWGDTYPINLTGVEDSTLLIDFSNQGDTSTGDMMGEGDISINGCSSCPGDSSGGGIDDQCWSVPSGTPLPCENCIGYGGTKTCTNIPPLAVTEGE